MATTDNPIFKKLIIEPESTTPEQLTDQLTTQPTTTPEQLITDELPSNLEAIWQNVEKLFVKRKNLIKATKPKPVKVTTDKPVKLTERITVNLPAKLLSRARNAVFALENSHPELDVSLNDCVVKGLRNYIKLKEEEFNNGKKFPEKTGELHRGRKKVVS